MRLLIYKALTLLGRLTLKLILNLPFTRKGMEAVANLRSHTFLRLMREKFESYTDENLNGILRMIKSPEGKLEKEWLAYLAGLGILDGIKEAAEQEIFLRQYRKNQEETKEGEE